MPRGFRRRRGWSRRHVQRRRRRRRAPAGRRRRQPSRRWSGSTKRVAVPDVAAEIERGERRPVRAVSRGGRPRCSTACRRAAPRRSWRTCRTWRTGGQGGCGGQGGRGGCGGRPRRFDVECRRHRGCRPMPAGVVAPASAPSETGRRRSIRRARRTRCVPPRGRGPTSPGAPRPRRGARALPRARTAAAQQAAQATQAASDQDAERVTRRAARRARARPTAGCRRRDEHGRHRGEGEQGGARRAEDVEESPGTPAPGLASHRPGRS